MVRKLLLSLASIFLVFQSIDLIKFLEVTRPSQFSWIGIIATSFILNLYITGIFAFVGFAFLTHKILPKSYYKIKNSKNLILIYDIFGVHYFKVFLLKFFWGMERNRKKYFNGTKTGIQEFDVQTRQSEFGHLAALITILIISFFILLKGHYLIFCITTFINTIGNFYPIILQRHHRIQIERLQIIMEIRKSTI